MLATSITSTRIFLISVYLRYSAANGFPVWLAASG
jgi:hypothetical protein